MISRRAFLAIAAGSALAPRVVWAAEQVPTMLDHILLGCSDLDQGIAIVERHSGVRPAFGGVHPGRGTQNALLSLGNQHYLEVIAPDPKQNVDAKGPSLLSALKQLSQPRLVDWAVHTINIQGAATRLRSAGIGFHGPTPGLRRRPDGHVLNWKTLNLDDDHHGLIPFFIEWGADSMHPSLDAPAGCELVSFAVEGPDPAGISEIFKSLGIDVQVERAVKNQLHANIKGPAGKLELT